MRILIYSTIMRQHTLEILRTRRFLLKHYYSSYRVYFLLKLF